VGSPLTHLFESFVEGAPVAAVSVVVFPSNSLSVDGSPQPYPVYIMIHSSETGECPQEQCILYASTLTTKTCTSLLENALSTFLQAIGEEHQYPTTGTQILYKLSYEQRASSSPGNHGGDGDIGPSPAFHPSLDLAFNDQIVDDVKETWKTVMSMSVSQDDHNQTDGASAGDSGEGVNDKERENQNGPSLPEFMKFEDRKGQYDDDDDDYL